MMIRTAVKSLAVAALACPTLAGADLLVDWSLETQDFSGEANNAAFLGLAPTEASVATNLSVTDLTTDSNSGEAGLVHSSGSPAAGELNLQRWDRPDDTPATFGNGNGNPNNWLEYSIVADAGYQFTVDTLNISLWRNGGGAPENMRFDYSTDGGTTWLEFDDSQQVTQSGDSTFRALSFTNAGITDTDLLIRFVAFGPVGGTGNIHINDLTAEGSVSLIPEPGSLALLSLGGLLIARRRRA